MDRDCCGGGIVHRLGIGGNHADTEKRALYAYKACAVAVINDIIRNGDGNI